MIEYLCGKLLALAPGQAVVEVGAVGLALEVPDAAEKLEQLIGTEVKFYTRLVFRDDEFRLYGFSSAEERNLFNLITGVSGFGPRNGLALLSTFTVPQLCAAVFEEDIATLSQAPGIGRKLAQRLIFELKEKLPRLYSPEQLALSGAPDGPVTQRAEIIEALAALGYSRAEAAAAVNKAAANEGGLTSEELLKKALNTLAGGQGKSG
ncbi:MAG TPA: Holliday junction branch migration protein RuvA [Bacillota bacterium]|nr:Holliday junction branch migration protein RuvA [Bacillota bacterium]HOA35507.1 Holliday junction branch migration protein RuvA [Bacillota bacterium]HOJ84429.1 Holliday junction branch migration protein RuvA [Bacillota bacterium]HOL15820.1 Holliday junction branch migration protein RuvA [Bacillota bacterium]HPZ12189.1 Holliday junction branch migration protein RuvA [Bacillota bacterium]